MSKADRSRTADVLFERWPTLSPQVHSTVIDLLLRSGTSTKEFLAVMAAGKIPPAVVNLEQRERLLRSRDKSIHDAAEKLFGGPVSANRLAVGEKYRPALTAQADAVRGHAVFKKICVNCHKIAGEGHDIGPDITDVRKKTRETLLYDILDPNRAVDPRYTNYVVTTIDGRSFNGLLAEESEAGIVLRRAEGKQDIVPRADIDELRASGKSLMPEGVEKEVDVQQMADLLEFLTARKPSR